MFDRISNPKSPVGWYKDKSVNTPVIVREYQRRLPALPSHPERKKVASHEKTYKRLRVPITLDIDAEHNRMGRRAWRYEGTMLGDHYVPAPVKHPHAKVQRNPNDGGEIYHPGPSEWLHTRRIMNNPSEMEYRKNTKTLLFSSVFLLVFTIVARVAGSE